MVCLARSTAKLPRQSLFNSVDTFTYPMLTPSIEPYSLPSYLFTSSAPHPRWPRPHPHSLHWILQNQTWEGALHRGVALMEKIAVPHHAGMEHFVCGVTCKFNFLSAQSTKPSLADSTVDCENSFFALALYSNLR